MTGALLGLDGVGVTIAGRAVVRGVSLALPSAALVALVGPNGAGKTTLLRAIAGLIAHGGSVRLDSRPVEALDAGERARSFAYLPQGHVAHWPLPVRDIVALGRYPHGLADPARLAGRHAAAVARALAATGAAALADRRVTELSGGERARVALARVLAVEAPVILADEPTAALDPRYQLEVMGVLAETAARGSLVVAVTHDLGLAARFAQRVLVMHEGEIVAEGAPAEALAPEVLRKVFRIDAFRAERDGHPVLVPWGAA